MREQQRAIERMREMSQRVNDSSPHTMPPSPPFVQVNGRRERTAKQNNFQMHENALHANNAEYADPHAAPFNANATTTPDNKHYTNENSKSCTSFLGIDLPILDRIKNEPDMTLILGILLILWSEKADKKLLLALLYILF